MERHESHQVTTLLRRIDAGDSDAESALFGLVYEDLKSIASKLMKSERSSHTLGTTGVLHEAYARLFNEAAPSIADRRHFARLITRAMKHVLLDHARTKKAAIHGGNRQKVGLDLALEEFEENQGVTLPALAEALDRLKETHPRAAEVVELRFFGNYTMPEIGEILAVSKTTADNDWLVARARLRLLLQERE
jgi:RNA polymerase sigma factor (TIGR02999 family)